MLYLAAIYLITFFGRQSLVASYIVKADASDDQNIELRTMDSYGEYEEENDISKMQIIFPGMVDIVLNFLNDTFGDPDRLVCISRFLTGHPYDHTWGAIVAHEVFSHGEKCLLPYSSTKWCGAGNIAGHDEDYGFFEASDRCCKKHDYCPETMAGGETKYELYNEAFYTRLHCDCDKEFYDCLKKTNSFISDDIGFTYFNAISTRCYKEDYPIIKCHQYSTAIRRRCRIYELDKTKPKIWQWFDLPIY